MRLTGAVLVNSVTSLLLIVNSQAKSRKSKHAGGTKDAGRRAGLAEFTVNSAASWEREAVGENVLKLKMFDDSSHPS